MFGPVDFVTLRERHCLKKPLALSVFFSLWPYQKALIWDAVSFVVFFQANPRN